MVTDRRHLHGLPTLAPEPVEPVRYPSPMVLTAEADEVNPDLNPPGGFPRREHLPTLHLVTPLDE